jgi:hypothetical protein
MGNHYHLALHTLGANLSAALHYIDGVYTQRFNRRHHTTGPLFGGRYHATVVDHDRYLLALVRYIERNPVAAGIAAAAAAYPWSSHRAHLGLTTPPRWLTTETVLAVAGGPRSLHDLVASPDESVDAELAAALHERTHRAACGDAAFVVRVLADVPARPSTSSSRRRTQPRLTINEIESEVAAALGLALFPSCFPRRSIAMTARDVAMWLARDRGGLSLDELAGRYGVGCRSSVSAAISRLLTRRQHDPELQRAVTRIHRRLAPAVDARMSMQRPDPGSGLLDLDLDVDAGGQVEALERVDRLG